MNGRAPEGMATLKVRPESIHVSAGGDPPAASLRGKIVQTSFLGSMTRVAVGCDSVPAPITASLFGHERLAARDLTPDMEVALWWDGDDAVLLKEEQLQEVQSSVD